MYFTYNSYLCFIVAYRFTNFSLFQFKNYQQQFFEFNQNIVAITGKNGSGKTNLLDAVYFTLLGKSYFNSTESTIPFQQQNGFRLEATLLNSDEMGSQNSQLITCKCDAGKKEITINKNKVEKLSRYIGQFPAVFIAPDDIEIINGDSRERRRFIDQTISQLDNQYLYALLKYNAILKNRNALLKNFYYSPNYDLLSVLNEQLQAPAEYIYTARTKWLTQLLQTAQTLYNQISGVQEVVTYAYASQLHENNFIPLLTEAQQQDIILKRTTTGIHKDDLHFFLNNIPFKQHASQGQKKTLLFALKLAQFKIIEAHTGKTPTLLLDDIFEKLDHERMNYLLQFVATNKGQVFITDTHTDRIQNSFRSLSIPAQIIEL